MTTQQIVLSLVLATMVFSVALELKLADFQNVAKTPRAVVAGLLPQFVLLPVATWAATLVLDRGTERIALEMKAGRGDNARAVRTLREAMPDVQAQRGWIVDQAPGIERVSANVARAHFEQVMQGAP